MGGETPIALVACGDGHDGARSVPGQNVIGNPYRHERARHGVHDVAACKDAGNALVALAVAFGLHARSLDIGFNFGALGVGREVGDEAVLRGEDQEGHAVERVWPRGEDFDFSAGRVGLAVGRGNREAYRGSFGATDPVALGFFDAVRPVQVVQTREETVRVRRDAHHPLAHGLFDDRVSAPFAQAVLDFVVGEHRAKGRAPIDFAVGEVGDAKAHEDFMPLGFRHAGPVRRREGAVEVFPKMRERQPSPPLLVACCVHVVVAVFGKGGREVGDGAGFLGLGVVPAFKKLPKKSTASTCSRTGRSCAPRGTSRSKNQAARAVRGIG